MPTNSCLILAQEKFYQGQHGATQGDPNSALFELSEIDLNFRLLYYSSSLQENGTVLRLHRDVDQGDAAIQGLPDPIDGVERPFPSSVNYFDDIPLPSGGSGLTINGNVDNRILTATGLSTTIDGESNLQFDGSKLIITGSIDITTGNTDRNIFIGEQAGENATTTCTVNIGYQAGESLTGNRNTVLGAEALINAGASSRTLAIGHCSLTNLSSGNFNTAIGAQAGECITSGASNVLIGYSAGPSAGSTVSDKLYINNAAGTPLIYGDFSTGHVEIKTALSASSFSGSFHGDGSNLTGINTSAFPYNGDAVITGSLTVSGSSVVVDLTDTISISGSVFSGSFTGDGSGLTGVSGDGFPYTGSARITGSLNVIGPVDFEGNTSVTGSFIVSGSTPAIDLKGITTVDKGIKIHSPNVYSIGIGASSLGSNTGGYNTALGYLAGCETGTCTFITAVGSYAGKKAGTAAVALGTYTLVNVTGESNTAVGHQSIGGGSGTGRQNSALGYHSLYTLSNGSLNTGIGYHASQCITTGNSNTSIGQSSLRTMGTGNFNTALGSLAGCKTVGGNSNVYIGYKAGPSTANTTESNKLYINNNEGNPLIKGDFAAKTLTLSGSLNVSQSITADSFVGDGSSLTGVTAEWDGSHNGDASITGSLTVSGSSAVVDFTDVAAVSGSTFSGSFVGDGSGLTGLTGIEWDGSRDGDSNITGSLIVSGALDVGGTVTIASGSYPGGPGVELIQINASGMTSNTTLYTFAIDASNGYTGFKADYALTTAAEDAKKVGTVLGSWDRAGNSIVNEEHTLTSGDAISTSFSIDASSTTDAIFKVNVTSGTFEINALITAFKRVV